MSQRELTTLDNENWFIRTANNDKPDRGFELIIQATGKGFSNKKKIIKVIGSRKPSLGFELHTLVRKYRVTYKNLLWLEMPTIIYNKHIKNIQRGKKKPLKLSTVHQRTRSSIFFICFVFFFLIFVFF